MKWRAKDLTTKLSITAECMSRFENGKVVIPKGYERFLRALVCLGHIEAIPHIDVDPCDIANMRILPACDAHKRPRIILSMEKVAQDVNVKPIKWQRDKAA
jgi:hypothetical protein